MSRSDDRELERIEQQIRALRTRLDADVATVQGFVSSWRDFISMFTVANAKHKAGGFLGDAVEGLGDKASGAAQAVADRLMGLLKRD